MCRECVNKMPGREGKGGAGEAQDAPVESEKSSSYDFGYIYCKPSQVSLPCPFGFVKPSIPLR